MRKQQTFYVNGEKIVIISTIITSMRNFAGWRVRVNESEYKYFEACSRQEATDRAYVQWVKTR